MTDGLENWTIELKADQGGASSYRWRGAASCFEEAERRARTCMAAAWAAVTGHPSPPRRLQEHAVRVYEGRTQLHQVKSWIGRPMMDELSSHRPSDAALAADEEMAVLRAAHVLETVNRGFPHGGAHTELWINPNASRSEPDRTFPTFISHRRVFGTRGKVIPMGESSMEAMVVLGTRLARRYGAVITSTLGDERSATLRAACKAGIQDEAERAKALLTQYMSRFGLEFTP